MKTSTNPLFTRHEKRRAKKKAKHAVRAGLAKIFGIPLSKGLGGKSQTSRRGAHRAQKPSTGHGPSNSVRSDVISALLNQGYNKKQAQAMTPAGELGENFSSLFRRAIAKNPAELIIFGNPSKVYSRSNVIRAKRAGNPIPAALLQAFEAAAGSKIFEEATRTKRRNHGGTETRRHGEKKGKGKNPEATGRATQLFENFHHRGASGVFERQRSARQRKDYTILGPLVAIGVDAEKFEQYQRSVIKDFGREAWVGGSAAIPELDLGKNHPGFPTDHFDELPHLAFMTPSQIAEVKRILGDPNKYVQNAPLLASSPNGRQMYALAEDLEFDLSKFDTDAHKDLVDLGDATFVVYIAKKPQAVKEWVHMLGEKGGKRPRLFYDRLKKEVGFMGGSYSVKPEGIVH